MWILYILGGLFLFGVLKALGFFQELVLLAIISAVVGGICHFAFDAWDIGLMIGSGLYALLSVIRLFNPSTEVWTLNEQGEYDITFENRQRVAGVVGIIIFIGMVIYVVSQQ